MHDFVQCEQEIGQNYTTHQIPVRLQTSLIIVTVSMNLYSKYN